MDVPLGQLENVKKMQSSFLLSFSSFFIKNTWTEFRIDVRNLPFRRREGGSRGKRNIALCLDLAKALVPMLASVAFAEAWRQHQNPHLIANYCVQQQRKDAEKGNAVTHLRIYL